MTGKGQKRKANNNKSSSSSRETDLEEIVFFIACTKCGRKFIPRVPPKDIEIRICDECAAEIAIICMTDAAAARAVKYYDNK